MKKKIVDLFESVDEKVKKTLKGVVKNFKFVNATDKINGLKTLLKHRDNIQKERIRICNRLGLKSDLKTIQNVKITLRKEEYELLYYHAKYLKKQENELLKRILNILDTFPIYKNYLVNLQNVKAATSGWLVAMIDIHKAAMPSQIFQYVGFNPGMVRGVKRVHKGDYEKKMGQIINEVECKNFKTGRIGTDYFVVTDKMVRGDRLTPGFVSPFNSQLKKVLMGVMSKNFILGQTSYAMEYYYPYKERLSKEENIIVGTEDNESSPKKWKDTSPGHRDMAARRYMMKAFIKDLYVVWREMEGLPVRKPYEEEYLGIKHDSFKEENDEYVKIINNGDFGKLSN